MKRILPVRFVAKIEKSLSGIQQGKGDQICYKFAGQGAQKQNLTRAERIALRGLRNNPSIEILTADKRNATAVMDTADYTKKLTRNLNTGPHEEERKCIRSVVN